VEAVAIPPHTLDVGANGQPDALTDGILILRYLFGFTGEQLVDKSLGPGATRTDPGEIVALLTGAKETMLDVDANGAADALTDGTLILRYLFGFRGEALVEDAVAPNATRTTPSEIQDFLDQFDPGVVGTGSASVESSRVAGAGASVPRSVHETKKDRRTASQTAPPPEDGLPGGSVVGGKVGSPEEAGPMQEAPEFNGGPPVPGAMVVPRDSSAGRSRLTDRGASDLSTLGTEGLDRTPGMPPAHPGATNAFSPDEKRSTPSDSEPMDTVWGDLFHDHRDNERLADNLPDQAALYRALAFDAVQRRSELESEDKKEDSSTEALDFLMLQYDRLP
jgi:hypothetical protein